MKGSIVLFPEVTLMGPVTNSSSEMFICLTKRTPAYIFPFLRDLAKNGEANSKDDTWDSWQCDLDEASVKILKGSELVIHLANTWKYSMYPTEFTLASEDDEEREWATVHLDAPDRLPELSNIMFHALTTLPFETINKYNLNALPYSWPVYEKWDWKTEHDEYDIAMAAGLSMEDCYKEQTLKKNDLDEQNKARLLKWVEQNHEALDILIPNAVVFTSAEKNSVGTKMMDTITSWFNGVRIHFSLK